MARNVQLQPRADGRTSSAHDDVMTNSTPPTPDETHDLRNPIAAITIVSEVLRRRLVKRALPPEEIEQAIMSIDQAVAELADIVDRRAAQAMPPPPQDS